MKIPGTKKKTWDKTSIEWKFEWNHCEGDTLDTLIDNDLPLKRTKQQIINDPSPELPNYIKPLYPINKKKLKRQIEAGKFKKFLQMLTALQVNISFCDALEKMHVYAKFMNNF